MRLFKIFTRLAFLCSLTLGLTQAQVSYTITTVVGNNIRGFYGDGSAATSAEITNPGHMVIDGAGTLWFADQGNNRIRQVTAGGVINTVAGSTSSGYSGDAGGNASATKAAFSHPGAVIVDSSSNYYIADTDNNVIRKVTSAGVVSTIAGSNSLGAGYGGDTAVATSAQLNKPSAIIFDASGNLLIADTNNHRIRKVDSAGNITTIAGNGTAQFFGDGYPAPIASLNAPQALARDAAGNLYIADTANHVIRKIDTTGVITTIAGSGGVPGFSGDYGPATAALLNLPRDIVIDSAGNIFIADYGNSRVRRIGTDGNIITIAGNGQYGYTGDGYPATWASFDLPFGLALDGKGNIYVGDSGNSVIRLLTLSSTPVPAINKGGVASATAFGGLKGAAPGSWIEIYGSGFSTATRSWNSADFNGDIAPQSLEGTTVTIGDYKGYISYISPSQINVQIPVDAATGPQQVIVYTPTGSSPSAAIVVNPTQPGLLSPSTFVVNGKQYVAALFADGSTYAAPSGSLTGVSSRPAKVGETITLYGIGFGPVTPSPASGQITKQGNSLTASFGVNFGSTAATVAYAGLAPGTLGLYQFNIVVPSVPSNGAVPLTFTLGGQTLPQTLYTAVQ